MRRIKALGKDWEFHEDKRYKYDGYILNDEIYPERPAGSEITGYIRNGAQYLAICKRSYVKAYPIIYLCAGVLAMSVLLLSYKAICSIDVDVPRYSFESNRDDVVGELDEGVVKGSSKLAYSQYCTYDGENVAMYVEAKNCDIQLVFGSEKSEIVPVEQASKIPMHITMEVEDVLDGTMIVIEKGKEKTYPVTVEYLKNETPTLSTHDAHVEVQQTLAREVIEETIDNDNINAYVETDTDFENFDVVRPNGQLYDND